MARHGCGPRRRRQQNPLKMANAHLAAAANHLRRAVQYTGVYKLIPLAKSDSRLMALPPEIRLLIYEYVLGHRTIHIERGEDIGWHYFVCRGENGTHSELAVGEIWAGHRGHGYDVPGEGNGNSWQSTIPACRFAYRSSLGAVVRNCSATRWFIEAESEQDSREVLLHLDLLSVNRLVHYEAAQLVYRTTIFAFREVDAFREFADKEGQLASRVPNLVLYVEPRGRRMHLWNEWLREQIYSDYEGLEILSVFSSVQKLQIVVGGSKPLDEQCLWTVYGLFALCKLGVREVSVDVSLCSGDRDGAGRFARVLEGKLRQLWDDEAEREMGELEVEYASSPVGMVNASMVEGSRCIFPG
ncbi:hypothetical protein BJX68DRAFT_239369 [Aspergillus pseudodeflectus]|uniref:DUF7730 domain-containing protein n=1 Tax=Aspergillus pseudodeflectus TaxID=176178 RepID=A0ABR4K5K0_9EURO